MVTNKHPRKKETAIAGSTLKRVLTVSSDIRFFDASTFENLSLLKPQEKKRKKRKVSIRKEANQ